MESNFKVVFFLVFLNAVIGQQPIEDEECPEFHFNKDVSMTNEKVFKKKFIIFSFNKKLFFSLLEFGISTRVSQNSLS